MCIPFFQGNRVLKAANPNIENRLLLASVNLWRLPFPIVTTSLGSPSSQTVFFITVDCRSRELQATHSDSLILANYGFAEREGEGETTALGGELAIETRRKTMLEVSWSRHRCSRKITPAPEHSRTKSEQLPIDCNTRSDQRFPHSRLESARL